MFWMMRAAATGPEGALERFALRMGFSMTRKHPVWTASEVEVIVTTYLKMLVWELDGVQYSKTEQSKLIIPLLDGRTRASVEYKLRNVSAVMELLGSPHIRGYKPARNLQLMLRSEVQRQLSLHPDLVTVSEQ